MEKMGRMLSLKKKCLAQSAGEAQVKFFKRHNEGKKKAKDRCIKCSEKCETEILKILVQFNDRTCRRRETKHTSVTNAAAGRRR